MEEKKYRLTDEAIEFDGHILHRIQALKDFGNVKKGDFGGWIEKEDNLSQEGNCWIYPAKNEFELDSRVYEDARVYDNALIFYGGTIIRGNAKIYDEAKVSEYNFIVGNAHVYGKATINNRCWIDGNCQIYGNATVQNDAVITENPQIFENATVGDRAHIDGEAKIKGFSKVSGDSHIYGTAIVSGKCWISGKAKVHDTTIDSACTINGDVEISNPKDFMYFEGNEIFSNALTWTRSNDTWTRCIIYHHTNKELVEMGYKRSKQIGKLFESYVKKVEVL